MQLVILTRRSWEKLLEDKKVQILSIYCGLTEIPSEQQLGVHISFKHLWRSQPILICQVRN